MIPPALAAYLFFSRNFKTYGERILSRRLEQGKEHPTRIGERKGETTTPRPRGELIWFHAASVGEALSIQELMRRIADEDDTISFLITTVTVTSAQAVEARLPPNAIHQFVPLDFVAFVDGFLDHWAPDLAVWTESEIWPALLSGTKARRIPMVLLNARMSSKSYRRWRIMRNSARYLLGHYLAIHAQDDQSATYLRNLGAPADRIEVTGTLKEGSSALPHDEQERQKIAEAIGRRAIWLAASTHPDEEEIAALAHREVLRRAPRTLLIIVPRHPERGPEIAKKLRELGWRTALRSTEQTLQPDTEIYVADTLGELGLWYRVAPISFVGGSLAQIGGHNPFEPAALGSAILHGPHIANFADIYARLAEGKASRLVRGPDHLASEVINLLAPDRVATMAHAAWEVCSSGAGVTDRALELVLDSLGREG